MKGFYLKWLAVSIGVLTLAASCRKDDPVLPSEPTLVNPWEQVTGDIYGFFLLNEGNMGTNQASLDYYDYETGVYTRNIYGERNPYEVKDLGDVGNDIQIYGDKLWAVINCSNYVEVMDVNTAKHITKIAIPNCRYLAFKGKYAYVSAYAGPVQIAPDARIGYVAKIDTASLQVVDECIVGYQPEEMAIVGDKLYVANSGGYRVPNYDRTVSVIDLKTFTEEKKIDVAINLHRIQPDNYGNLYVSSRGDYYEIPSKTFIIDTSTDEVAIRVRRPAQHTYDPMSGFAVPVQYRMELYNERLDGILRHRKHAHTGDRYAQLYQRRHRKADPDTLWNCRQPEHRRVSGYRRQRLRPSRNPALLRAGRHTKMVDKHGEHPGTYRIHP